MTADVLLADIVAERDLNEVEARSLIDGMRVDVAGIEVRIKIAFHGRAWVSLGYPSWDAMCEAEFDGARLRIPREDRAEQVQSLRAAGLSTRAIGSALGMSEATVRRDLPTAGASSVAPTPVVGQDGKRYAPTQPPRPTTPSPAAAPADPTVTESAPSTAHAAPPAAGEGQTSPAPTSLATVSTPRRVSPAGGAGESGPGVGAPEAPASAPSQISDAGAPDLPIGQHPDYQPTNADLDRQLEDQIASTDERFRSNLVRACAPTYGVLDLDPQRVVATYLPGSDAAEALDLYLSRLDQWTATVRAGLSRRYLRSVR